MFRAATGAHRVRRRKRGDFGKVLLTDLLHLPRGVCVVIFAARLAVGLFVLERAFPQ